MESSSTIFQKLKIVGVGYRAESVNTLTENLIAMKLGYSHPVYAKTPYNLSIKSFSRTKFYIFGDSYNEVTNFSAKIRKKKAPDPYKGKGIRYENEQPILKEGKKV